jgi:hypothetical protein
MLVAMKRRVLGVDGAADENMMKGDTGLRRLSTIVIRTGAPAVDTPTEIHERNELQRESGQARQPQH